MNFINRKNWFFYKLLFNLKGYIVVDNFLKEDVCEHLRSYMLETENYSQVYDDYSAVDIVNIPELTKNLLNISILKNKKFLRCWSFIYENIAKGVPPHADSASINVNIWITPDDCILDNNKNGLNIWGVESPKDWDWNDYNKDHLRIENFLSDKKPINIKYKYNRAIIFKSKYFHSTSGVSTKPGHRNKRINYTFLFE
jgi:hypothetical protein